jgi:hypothetical protein
MQTQAKWKNCKFYVSTYSKKHFASYLIFGCSMLSLPTYIVIFGNT